MDEAALLEERHVRVMTAKIQIGETTYPLAGITSVRTKRESISNELVLTLAAAGAFIATGGLVSLAVSSRGDTPELVAGAIAAAFACFVLASAATASRRKARWRTHIILGTAGGDRQALTTDDEAFAASVRGHRGGHHEARVSACRAPPLPWRPSCCCVGGCTVQPLSLPELGALVDHARLSLRGGRPAGLSRPSPSMSRSKGRREGVTGR